MTSASRRSSGWYLWMWTIGSGLVFIGLIGVQQGWWSERRTVCNASFPAIHAMDTYYCATRNAQPIGYVHRTLSATDTGYASEETMRLRINTMGVLQEVVSRIEARLNPDLSVSDMSLFLGSGMFRFQATAQVLENQGLLIRTEAGQWVVPVSGPIHLPGFFLLAHMRDRPPSIDLFEPFHFSRYRVHVLAEERDTIDIQGKRIETRRLDVEAFGLQQHAWIDGTGEILRETGPMGLALEKCEAAQALASLSNASGEDWAAGASIAADKILIDPNSLHTLRLRLRGSTERLALDGDRQRFTQGELIIRKETVLPRCTRVLDNEIDYLKPSALVQSNHSEIVDLAATFITAHEPPGSVRNNPLSFDEQPSGSPCVRRLPAPKLVRSILRWMTDHIQKRPVLSLPNAVDTLRNGAGDCNEHAILFAALARACGIPTRMETGLVYLKGRFYYHAWNAVFWNEWITVDASMGQFPADVTHIRLTVGEDPMDLVSVMGNLELSIVEALP